MTISCDQAKALLFAEADYMDESRYDEWLALWTEDAIYWVPCNDDDSDPQRHVSLIYDDYRRLGDRVARLQSSAAHSQQPRSRMRRVVGNIRCESIAGQPDELTVIANFVLAELRHGHQDLFAGRTEHRLRLTEQGLRICFKKVLLLNNDEPIDNLTFLL